MISIPMSVRYMLLSALFFAMMSGCVKAANLRGIPVLEILAIRALISSVLSYIDIRRKRISPWGNNKPWLIARGVVGTASLICLFYAVTTLPLAEATLLQYFYPIFTSILAFFILRERILKSTMVSIILSLVGLFIMADPDLLPGGALQAATPLPTHGIIVALLGSLGTGTAYVIVRKLSKTEDPSVIIFYFPFIALPVSILLLGDKFIIPDGAMTWFLLLLVGIFTQIAQFCFTVAVKNEEAARAAAYSYAQIVFSTIIGWAFFMEIPTWGTLFGAFFIIGGALINIRSPFDMNKMKNPGGKKDLQNQHTGINRQ